MNCAHCQHEVGSDDAYCRACGAAQRQAAPDWTKRRLARVSSQGRIAGVCAGIAAYLGVDVTLVRIVWLTLSVVPGAIVGGIVAYAVAWLVMPEGAPAETTGRRLTRSSTDARIAGVCGGLADYFGVDATPIRVLWIVASLLPPVFVAGLVAYIAAWLIIPKAPTALMRPSQTQAA